MSKSPEARLTSLHDRLSGKQNNEISISEKRGSESPTDASVSIEPNPNHGDKGDFVKVTVTLPPQVYELLMQEVTRRKTRKLANPVLSAILREAAVAYLNENRGTAFT